MNENVEQRGEPAEASGLPFGTPNPANVTDADNLDAKNGATPTPTPTKTAPSPKPEPK